MHHFYFQTVPVNLTAEQQAGRALRVEVINAHLTALYPAEQEPPAELVEALQRHVDEAPLTPAQNSLLAEFWAAGGVSALSPDRPALGQAAV